MLREYRGQTYLSEPFGLSVFFKTKCWEMYTGAEDFSLGQNTNTANAVNLHLHVRVSVWVAQICKMRTPGSVFCIALHDDSILIKRISKSEGGFGFLPRIKIVRLLSAEPIGEWSPHICYELVHQEAVVRCFETYLAQ